MPIKPANRNRYPANWKTEIRPAILVRSDNRCECRGECGDEHGVRCDVPNGVDVVRHRTSRALWRRCDSFIPDEVNAPVGWSGKAVKIVLTIAHVNHTPEDCRPENLLALCQRCHLRMDRFHHAETRHRTRHKGQFELFQGEDSR